MRSLNPIEKFALKITEKQLPLMAQWLLLDLISLEPACRSLKGLTGKRNWLATPALEELSRLEEAGFVEGRTSKIELNWKALGLDLLECPTSPRKPLSAVLTLQTAFRRLLEPASAVKRPAQPNDLAAFRHISRFLAKNGLENRSEELLTAYFRSAHPTHHRGNEKTPSPSGFLSWLQNKFTPKS